MLMRSGAASAGSTEKRKKEEKLQLCHVLLHHWIGLQDSGPTPGEGSQTPLGCVPFCRAQPPRILVITCAVFVYRGLFGVVREHGSTP